MSRLSLYAAAAAFLVAANGARASSVRVEHWVTSCWKGTDEFALDCRARAQAAGLVFQLQTGDSQFFARVKAKGCEPPVEDGGIWWRDELDGLDVSARQHKVEEGLQAAIAAIAARCPSVRLPIFEFGPLPDIAEAPVVKFPVGPAPKDWW